MKSLMVLLALINGDMMNSKETNSRVMEALTASGEKFATDRVETKDGKELNVIFFRHASIGFVWEGRVVYVDPLTEYADYSKLPKADIVLVTHEHYDHLDPAAIDAMLKDGTVVIGNHVVSAQYPKARTMRPGQTFQALPGIEIEAFPAYNVSEHQLQFHPKEREDNGYIINFGGTRAYVAGDTEPIPEMENLRDIDIMFLPVNQPYTMTLEQAESAARTINAPIFYPYHTGDTDIEKLKDILADVKDMSVRIFPME